MPKQIKTKQKPLFIRWSPDSRRKLERLMIAHRRRMAAELEQAVDEAYERMIAAAVERKGQTA